MQTLRGASVIRMPMDLNRLLSRDCWHHLTLAYHNPLGMAMLFGWRRKSRVEKLRLPRLIVPARSPMAPAPPVPSKLVAARTAGLLMEARVVEFWSGSQGTRAAIQPWLQDLGFDVIVAASECKS
jgi:hypothetical protein